jgi:hypothetical protein
MRVGSWLEAVLDWPSRFITAFADPSGKSPLFEG